ncbi:MAG TPA: PaaI family thioesterase, partial [Solirubrobacteraceae bacterium]
RGEATFALPTTRWLCAPPPGRVQGGAVALLADAALRTAVQTAAPAGTAFVPIELKLNYLRPLPSDGREARAHAQLVHGGRGIAVARAEVTDADGRVIAIASGSAISEGLGHPR